MHGDIRAFNIVFGKKAGEGWLIDLDFGGEAGEATISSQSSTTIMHYGTSRVMCI